MKKGFWVHGCKEILDKIENGRMYTHVQKCADSDAEFWGVYQVMGDGTEEWIADFREWDDANLFALEKEKEETK